MQFILLERLALYRETKSVEAPPSPASVMVLILVHSSNIRAIIPLMISI